MTLVLVVAAVSVALVAGALWGLYGPFPKRIEGFVIALAGGALTFSVVLELLEPAARQAGTPLALAFLGLGALVFAAADYLIDEVWGNSGGGGLLAAVSLDGLPENLALGVALIGTGPMGAAALAGSIFLSNLPEAAGGAREMASNKNAKLKVLLIWSLTAVILAAAAVIGNLTLASAPKEVIAAIKSFAGGAVIASLATEVFPKAYAEDRHLAGVASAAGLMLAYWLNDLGG